MLPNLFSRHGYHGRQEQDEELSRDINILADTFRRSGGRQEVSRRAAGVDLATLTCDNLTAMLSELFHDGDITQERVMVLFYFCSDLAIRAVRSGLSTVVTWVTRWSLAFIRGTVSAVVRCRGGWRHVLSHTRDDTDTGHTTANTDIMATVNQVAILSACAAVVGVCAVYIKKNL